MEETSVLTEVPRCSERVLCSVGGTTIRAAGWSVEEARRPEIHEARAGARPVSGALVDDVIDDDDDRELARAAAAEPTPLESPQKARAAARGRGWGPSTGPDIGLLCTLLSGLPAPSAAPRARPPRLHERSGVVLWLWLWSSTCPSLGWPSGLILPPLRRLWLRREEKSRPYFFFALAFLAASRSSASWRRCVIRCCRSAVRVAANLHLPATS